MEEYKVSVWYDNQGWYVSQTGDNHIYVFTTKRSALRKAETLLDGVLAAEGKGEGD